MMGMNKPDLIKEAFSILNGVLFLALTWFVGQRLTHIWNIRQKRSELQLASLQQFYVAYGEFFAVWKLWNRLDHHALSFDDRRWELLKRAAAAESTVEGILVKLSLEIDLKENADNLGRFRQAFQQLRESIRDTALLPWPSGDCPEYKTFKALAIVVAGLLNAKWSSSRICSRRARKQLETITSNQWEGAWILPEYQELSRANSNNAISESSV
jgi:hypothetical protein